MKGNAEPSCAGHIVTSINAKLLCCTPGCTHVILDVNDKLIKQDI